MHRTVTTRTQASLGIAFAMMIALQLHVLYTPVVPGGGPQIPHLDKVIHLAVFTFPTLIGLWVGFNPRWFIPVIAAHALVSEVIQHLALQGRTGDPGDVAANLLGVLFGWALFRLLRSSAGSAPLGSVRVSGGVPERGGRGRSDPGPW